MKYSRLLSAMMNGRWMIRPEDITANNPIIERLLDRKYSDEEYSAVLSDKKAMQVFLSEPSTKVQASSDQYDKIPQNSTAIFDITGTMLKYGTWCSYGTQELSEAIREAAAHPKVDSIILNMDSGGGSVDAIPPLVDVIQYAQSLGKPVLALVDLCASAAYFVASYCDEIMAENNISSEIGSIGVMMGWRDYSEYYAKMGIKETTVYSSHSDWKNLPFRKAQQPKGEGEEAQEPTAMIQSEMLDPLALTFQETVKANRPNLKQDVDGIIAGRMFFAQQAKDNGLIDSIGNMNAAIQRVKSLKSKDKYLISSYLQ